MNTDLQDIARLQEISRWHTVSTNRTQTVAEHSFNVAAMVSVFLTRLGYESETFNRIMIKALYHDIDEAYSGDSPPNHKSVEYSKMDKEDLIIKAFDLLDAWFFASTHIMSRHHLKIVDGLMIEIHECKKQFDSDHRNEFSDMVNELKNMHDWSRDVSRVTTRT